MELRNRKVPAFTTAGLIRISIRDLNNADVIREKYIVNL